MWDKPIPSSQQAPMSPLGAAGGASPNPHVSLPSPGGSPPAGGMYIPFFSTERLNYSTILHKNIILRKIKGILSTKIVIFSYPKLLSFSVLTFIK